MKFALLLTVTACGISTCSAWGASGHEAVGYVAQQFLSTKALAFVQTSLGSTYSESLGVAATWADNIKSNSAYAWASELHYVDAEDAPPSTCSVSESRDCPTGRCILTAIANYTTRVVTTSLSAAQRQEALKFLDHFIGDIGQPLHVEAKNVGGNTLSVICSQATTNLHSLWDSGIINKLLVASYNSSSLTWANALATRIKTGTYQTSAASWISCSSTTAMSNITLRRSDDDVSSDIKGLLRPRATLALQCPLTWAKESNAYDCSFVFNYASGTDLCTGSYYTNSIPIIEQQIAKQGYRLAAWLNVLFDGATNLP